MPELIATDLCPTTCAAKVKASVETVFIENKRVVLGEDTLTHGGAVVPDPSTNVFVNGKPFAKAGDATTPHTPNPPIPHDPGKLVAITLKTYIGP